MSTYFVDYENTSLKGLVGIEKLSRDDTVIIFYGKNTGSISFDEHVRISTSAASIRYMKTERVGKNYLDFQLATYCGYLISTSTDKEFYIVSKDTGYESVIDFWRTMNPSIVLKRLTQIVEKTMEKKEELIHTTPLYLTNEIVENSELAAAVNLSAATMEKKKKIDPSKSKKPPKKKMKSSGGKLPEKMKKKIRTLIKGEQLKGASYNQIYTSIMSCKDKQNFLKSLHDIFEADLGNRIYNSVLPVYEEYQQEQVV